MRTKVLIFLWIVTCVLIAGSKESIANADQNGDTKIHTNEITYTNFQNDEKNSERDYHKTSVQMPTEKANRVWHKNKNTAFLTTMSDKVLEGIVNAKTTVTMTVPVPQTTPIVPFKDTSTTTTVSTTTKITENTTTTKDTPKNENSTVTEYPTTTVSTPLITLTPIEENTTMTSTTTTSLESTTPELVCDIVNVTHALLEETSKLRIEWKVNDVDLCTDKTLSIHLTDNNCLTRCLNEQNLTFCYNNCTKNSNPKINILALSYSFPHNPMPCSEHYFKMILSNQIEHVSELFDAPRKYKTVSNFDVQDRINSTENEKQVDMIITWKYEYEECRQTFSISANSQSMKHQTTTNETSYILYNLFACEEFVVRVYPENQDAYSVGTNITLRTIEPSPVRDLQVYQDNDKSLIKLNYSAPEYGSKCVKRYIALIENEFETYSADVSMKIISGVYACVTYNITVIASINDEDDAISHAPTTTISSEIESSTSVEPTVNPLDPQHHDNAVFWTMKTEPIVFNQPQQPQLVSKTEDSLKLSVIKSAETRNKCPVSKFRVKCTSNEDETKVYDSESKTSNVTIEDLTAFHNYSCVASLENEVGEISIWSSPSNFETDEGEPDPPQNVSIRNVNSTEFTIEWDPPKQPKGIIKSYVVVIKFLNFTYNVPSYCNDSDVKKLTEETVYSNQNPPNKFTFSKALPSAVYTVQVQARNSLPGKFSELKQVTTIEGQPELVENFKIHKNEIKDLFAPYNKTVVVSFQPPCRANGRLTGFIVEFDQKKLEVEIQDGLETYDIKYDDLDPSIIYKINVYANSTNHKGKETYDYFELEPGIPTNDNNKTLIEEIQVEVSTTQAILSIPSEITDSEVGKIEIIKIIIGQMDCQTLIPKRGFEEEDIMTWKDVKEKSCIPVYDTSNFLNNPINGRYIEEIGNDLTCADPICNGPLRPGTTYGVTLRLFTKTGFSDTVYRKITTKTEIPLIMISIIILSILCMVFLIGFYISCRRTNALKNSSLDSPYDRKDISVQNFHLYYATMTQNENEKTKEEFRSINSFSDSTDKPSIASMANQHLNRYANIFPFDSTRVVLNDDEYDNDYINASYVNGYYYPKEYIAAQGPKPQSTLDFWRMVLQHHVESIVMLTSLVEGNKIKCHEYYPKLNGMIKLVNITVRCVEEHKYDNYIKRILEVEKDDVKLKVKHYYFSSWPDHGCPNKALDLIDFVRIVRNERQRLGETFIVHCSAGVGRTGTFIALDIMMQRIKKEGKINIFDLVKQLRNQRMKMVQTHEQYAFLYQAALELVNQPKGKNVIRNLQSTVLNYIHEFEIPEKWKLRRNRPNVGKTTEKLSEVETSM